MTLIDLATSRRLQKTTRKYSELTNNENKTGGPERMGGISYDGVDYKEWNGWGDVMRDVQVNDVKKINITRGLEGSICQIV